MRSPFQLLRNSKSSQNIKTLVLGFSALVPKISAIALRTIAQQ
ncbi:MAG: hypothetical protein AB4062_20020 [Crocosphaera sp.]